MKFENFENMSIREIYNAGKRAGKIEAELKLNKGKIVLDVPSYLKETVEEACKANNRTYEFREGYCTPPSLYVYPVEAPTEEPKAA